MTRRIREREEKQKHERQHWTDGSCGKFPLSFFSPSSLKAMLHGTTILAIRRGGKVVVVGDGQVSLGQTVMKRSARKVRKLHHDKVIAGFAGATADAFTLFEKFEGKLEQFNGNLKRAAVELAKDWRTDRILRRLEALLIRQWRCRRTG
jgi:hypothetical protein